MALFVLGVNKMSVIGIMRYLMDNDYTFIARTQKGNRLGQVAVYHDNSSSMIGASGPWRQDYSRAVLLGEGKVLARARGEEIFSGDEVFPLFTVSEDQYQGVFDHSRDAQIL